jgi:HEAT repeat protein
MRGGRGSYSGPNGGGNGVGGGKGTGGGGSVAPGGATGSGSIPKPNIPTLPAYALETGPATEDPADWRKWWEFNQQAYLDLGGRLHGSLSLGEGAGADEPTDYASYVRARLDKSLRALIEKAGGTNPYVSSAVLALAEVAQDPGDGGLDPYISYYLHEGTADLRGAAALALAVEGRAGTLQALESLLADDAEGRRLAQVEQVPPVLRAFAAYGLGLSGARAQSAEERTAVVRALFAALQAPANSEEIRVAAVIAIGLVPLDEKLGPAGCDCGGIGHDPETSRLSQIAWLCDVLGDEKMPVAVRVHVPTALARLVPGMPEEVRALVAEALLPVLEKGAKEYGAVRQSCVIALGEIARPNDADLDRRIRAALQRTAGFGEEASRRLALVALARGAGKAQAREAAVRDAANFLEQSLASSQNRIRPWGAVALGVLAHELRQNSLPVPGDIPAALRSGLERARTTDEFAACALGAGLSGDASLAEPLVAGLATYKDDTARGMAALGLGMMRAESALPALLAVLDEPVHRTAVHDRAALAVGMIAGDALVPELVAKLAASTNAEARASYVRALGGIGSPAAVDALEQLVGDTSGQLPARRKALQSLGTLAAREGPRWNVTLGPNQNYLAATWCLSNRDRSGVLDLE